MSLPGKREQLTSTLAAHSVPQKVSTVCLVCHTSAFSITLTFPHLKGRLQGWRLKNNMGWECEPMCRRHTDLGSHSEEYEAPEGGVAPFLCTAAVSSTPYAACGAGPLPRGALCKEARERNRALGLPLCDADKWLPITGPQPSHLSNENTRDIT